MPVIHAQIFGIAHAQNAGGVDQHVQSRVLRQLLAAHRLHLLRPADVQHHARVRQIRVGELAVKSHHLGALRQKMPGDLLADAARRAGHPHAFAGEVHLNAHAHTAIRARCRVMLLFIVVSCESV